MPMGPVELADTVGLDVCASVGKILNPIAGRRHASSTRWWRPASSARSRARASTSGRTASREKAEPETPYDKFELERLGRELVDPLIRECERVRDERIVESADLVDAGVIFGTGFAPFRGGPLHFLRASASRGAQVQRRGAAPPAAE